ncbi:DUF3592 domain-containing protein [Conexibacter woesei]|uniref:DUF3592 domain-containing protein n=1 Tax=Conexibacter woesei TaxID=191495 RepID=UPI0004040137|nr:DUF3592 domain-containing protein [Conexibacter woesei]
MGFLKDIRNLQKQAEAMTPPEHRGMAGGMRRMRDGVAQANQVLGDLQADGVKAQHLMANGQAGSATITAVRDTGMTINDNPTVEMDLDVSLGGGEPYAVTHRQTISRIAIPSFQPGATVPVRVDPADRTSLMIG